MKIKTAVVALASAAVVAGGVGAEQAGAASSHTTQHRSKTISFTAVRKTMSHVDAAPSGPSAGDSTYIGGHIAKGNASGYTTAQCVAVTSEDGGIAQCQVDLVLRHGTLVTLGTSVGDEPRIKLAVVGGTGRYARATGSGSLLPTKSGSNVVLHVHSR
ncbi:hypothetical protein [uncultured Jatrophihabitans sp.]|uniref:hypothetical protein n=1 Tax=uncultured Jatrophihabitans sp. TaxID=1610747 RepID=UPI0035CBE09E